MVQPETDDGLPPYADEVATPPTPEPGSPTMSNDSDDFSKRSTDFSGVASQIGFGNNVSWGSSAATSTVQHSFGDSTSAAATTLPSPPDSEDGFEKIRKQPSVTLAPPIGQSIEEDFEMVKTDVQDGDTEMTSFSNPPA